MHCNQSSPSEERYTIPFNPEVISNKKYKIINICIHILIIYINSSCYNRISYAIVIDTFYLTAIYMLMPAASRSIFIHMLNYALICICFRKIARNRMIKLPFIFRIHFHGNVKLYVTNKVRLLNLHKYVYRYKSVYSSVCSTCIYRTLDTI